MIHVRLLLFFCYLFSLSLYGMQISKDTAKQPLLPDSMLYVDDTKKITIETIGDQHFFPVDQQSIGFGYSPDFNVWIKIVLSNPYNEKMERIIEYSNPLTTHIELYDGKNKVLLYKGGMTEGSVLKSINPAFPVTLMPMQTKIYYMKASSSVTTLIVGLTLWEKDAFYQNEVQKEFILALFFGAMVIIILYNLFIYFSVRERVYLYYVLAFASIVVHHLFYKGLAGLYFLSPQETYAVVKYAAFIVAFPAFFLGLFTQSILNLSQYPKLNKLLTLYLMLFWPLTFLCFLLDLNNIRSLWAVIMLILLFGITLYAMLKHNRQAKFIMIGWIVVMSSGLLMYLSSIGYSNIFQTIPYYVESALLIETLLFSLILADRLKQLRVEKIKIQENMLHYQKEEESRLSRLIAEKTAELQKSVEEKDLLLKELNHRVKNSIQTIISFLRLQIDETEDRHMQKELTNIENRIMSISHLYALLHTKHDLSHIQAYEYFSLLIEHIQNTLVKPHIHISLHTDISLDSDIAVYCGFIINEAVTNALQHAFETSQKGTVQILLTKDQKQYHLTIKDNGKGFDTSKIYNSLGLLIMESLANYQLHGSYTIKSHNTGTNIYINWEKRK